MGDILQMFPELIFFEANTVLKGDRIAVSFLALKHLSVAYRVAVTHSQA